MVLNPGSSSVGRAAPRHRVRAQTQQNDGGAVLPDPCRHQLFRRPKEFTHDDPPISEPSEFTTADPIAGRLRAARRRCVSIAGVAGNPTVSSCVYFQNHGSDGICSRWMRPEGPPIPARGVGADDGFRRRIPSQLSGGAMVSTSKSNSRKERNPLKTESNGPPVRHASDP